MLTNGSEGIHPYNAQRTTIRHFFNNNFLRNYPINNSKMCRFARSDADVIEYLLVSL